MDPHCGVVRVVGPARANMSAETEGVFGRIVQLLKAANVEYRTLEHEPTYTSADSARVRGLPLGSGAKALVLKCDGVFRLMVMPADRKLQSRLARVAFGAKDIRFATPEELLALTGLVPGAVPPFGEPVLPFPLYADASLGREHPEIAFNAGELTRSIIMTASAWASVAKPQWREFAVAGS
jgi:Ala-tRNA(Pro) deacylase